MLLFSTGLAMAQELSPLQVLLSTQCTTGGLHPDLYQSGAAAMEMGCEAGPSMSPECASVKLMQHLKYRDLPLGSATGWRVLSCLSLSEPETSVPRSVQHKQ